MSVPEENRNKKRKQLFQLVYRKNIQSLLIYFGFTLPNPDISSPNKMNIFKIILRNMQNKYFKCVLFFLIKLTGGTLHGNYLTVSKKLCPGCFYTNQWHLTVASWIAANNFFSYVRHFGTFIFNWIYFSSRLEETRSFPVLSWIFLQGFCSLLKLNITKQIIQTSGNQQTQVQQCYSPVLHLNWTKFWKRDGYKEINITHDFGGRSRLWSHSKDTAWQLQCLWSLWC